MRMPLSELAERLGCTLRGDGAVWIEACASLEDAGPEHVSFLANSKYRAMLATTRAGAVILSSKDADIAPASLNLLVAPDAYFAFRQAMVALHGFRKQPAPGVHPLAFVHPDAKLGPDCAVQPFAYIESGARLGARCVVYPNAYIGADAKLGDDCVLYPGVVVYERCELGNRVILQAGTVIGEDGFGYATNRGAHHKIPQAGNVVVQDDVEFGANCAVDRGTVGPTVVGEGSKFSNLVTLGHGCRVGRHNLMVAQVGLAGSVRTGDACVFGGQAGVAGHLSIADKVQVAARSAVASDLTQAGATYGGSPADLWPRMKRILTHVSTLPELYKDIREVQDRLDQLLEKKG